MRLVYLGTPQFAVPPLEALAAAGHDIVAVFTQPDRPKGRGQQMEKPPVKQAAERLGLPVLQPERIRHPEPMAMLKELQVPAMVVVGYGQILPQALIDLAPLGIVNIHASLLPKYRGAAPIQWAVAEGETETGVTAMRIDAGLDTGDILKMRPVPIGPEETAEELSARLAAMGAELIVETMADLEAGRIRPEPQDSSQATLARILTKEDGRIDWNWDARRIHNRVRGFQPWPGAFTVFRGKQLRVMRTRLTEETWDALPGTALPGTALPGTTLPGTALPGTVMVLDKRRLVVACGSGSVLELLEVQMEGRGRVSGEAFGNGQRPQPLERLGDS